MKGYTIQNSIDLLEKGGNSSGGSTSAENVTFDNTGTGLVATNVQAAIVEVAAAPVFNFSTIEHVIGQWIDGRPLYEKTIDFGALPASAAKTVEHGIVDLDYIVEFVGVAKRPGDSVSYIPLPATHYQTMGNQEEISANDTVINIRNGNASANLYTVCYVTLRYIKTAPVNNTRKSKKK